MEGSSAGSERVVVDVRSGRPSASTADCAAMGVSGMDAGGSGSTLESCVVTSTPSMKILDLIARAPDGEVVNEASMTTRVLRRSIQGARDALWWGSRPYRAVCQ
jgi:hypothetical protein